MSRFGLTMPDTPLLSATGHRNIYFLCSFMFYDDDEARWNSTLKNCAEQIKDTGHRTPAEQLSLTARCKAVGFGVVDNATGEVNKQRLTELVNKTTHAFSHHSEKTAFLKDVVDTCGFWECLEKPCQTFTVSIPPELMPEA